MRGVILIVGAQVKAAGNLLGAHDVDKGGGVNLFDFGDDAAHFISRYNRIYKVAFCIILTAVTVKNGCAVVGVYSNHFKNFMSMIGYHKKGHFLIAAVQIIQ